MSDFETPRGKLLWSVQISVRYHNHRRRFYDSIHTTSSFITVILGSGTVVLALKDLDPNFIVIAGLLVTFFSTLDLVWGTTKKARHHFDLSKRFINLEREIIKAKDSGDMDVFTDRRLEIEADEPPVLRVLWDYCYNEMLQLRGTEQGNICKFEWYHRLTRDFFDFLPDKIKPDESWEPHRKHMVDV